MLKCFVVFRWFAVLLLLVPASAPFADGDPVALQQQLLDALSRGDVPGALALFTDDAVIDSASGPCTEAPCVGKAAIEKDLQQLVVDKTRRVTPLKTYIAGPLLITRFEARSAKIKDAGVDRIVLWGIREMQGDKIASIRCCMPERTDPQTARFLDWDFAHPSIE